MASKTGAKSVSEYLTQSCIEVEGAAALSRIKIIWGLRLSGNFVFLAALVYFIALLFSLELDGGLIVLGVFIGMWVLESYVIIAFFSIANLVCSSSAYIFKPLFVEYSIWNHSLCSSFREYK
ncbi:hypothetical protein GL2_43200 [Microbulbifer sp. GL-2]|nr:hypothetical protein GL2_43200 [Microbulbifer sp. GL-2]